MGEGTGSHAGRRVREIRHWRGMSLKALADLSGFSQSYVSMLERGQRPFDSRRTLEAIANALRVSPVELTGRPYEAGRSVSADTTAATEAMKAVDDALTGWWLGEVPDVPARPWPAIAEDVRLLNLRLRPNAEYAAQGAVLPGLICDLLAAALNDPEHRSDALVGLIGAYKAAAYLAHDLSFAGLPALAVDRMRQVAEELSDPVWTSYAAYQRAQLLSGANRRRQYEMAVAAADAAPATRPEVQGMANLTAAMASAAQGDGDTAEAHLSEAAALAELIDADVSPWCQTNFGRTNVGIWRLSIGVELGGGARVAEAASTVRPGGVSQSRQAAFWIDYGRALLTERKTQDRGLAALLQAETLAPQKLRTNPFVRETVANLLGAARRDAGARDLRGLAYRLGIAA
jgi:transcriptional regulator with XRE-family HTH domain